eukprot:TRINITY_DN6083_c0_g1_i8.p1 TRINITY_DN6083_c0_g1~~TRINITY_DN6083_c0_g1_i8.p1  ORF type:complete len:253 (+),score=72.44 TRINITY_DN6083_c0_g1_i8:115-873(+)
MIRRPPRSTLSSSSAASDVYKRQVRLSRRLQASPPFSRQLSTVGSKPRVVILGTGWAGFNTARMLDKDLFHVTVVSPSNHFLFTPLLPSTAVGTLEFRAIQEPIRTVPGVTYDAAKATSVDLESQSLICRDVFKNKSEYVVGYDYLIIACGSKTNTFNTPGVSEREVQGKGEVCFLKHLYHAKMIRNRILECFERASSPGITPEERDRLLSFVVVGGGPTSCEFTGELHDFVTSDVVHLEGVHLRARGEHEG